MPDDVYTCPTPGCNWHGLASEAVPAADGKLACPDCGALVEKVPPADHDPNNED
ncbi:MAG TPA: hypothetical protein VKD72_20885 [Gemmataceae bacterium]|nr:hypothetical protein [Gemmataceae bacterium]